MARDLKGVEPPEQKNLQVTPYVPVDSRHAGMTEAATETDSEAGFDLKYSVTPSLTLDATVNTDFAQVEADEQQINLDRFNLFFPEKRRFFLANSGLFSVGVTEEVELFFSGPMAARGSRLVASLPLSRSCHGWAARLNRWTCPGTRDQGAFLCDPIHGLSCRQHS